MEKTLENGKIIRKPRSGLVDNALLLLWFCQELRKGTPLSWPLIKEKVVTLHQKLEGEDETFLAVGGQLHRWKKHYWICQVVIAGKVLSTNQTAENQFFINLKIWYNKTTYILNKFTISMKQVHYTNATQKKYWLQKNFTYWC